MCGGLRYPRQRQRMSDLWQYDGCVLCPVTFHTAHHYCRGVSIGQSDQVTSIGTLHRNTAGLLAVADDVVVCCSSECECVRTPIFSRGLASSRPREGATQRWHNLICQVSVRRALKKFRNGRPHAAGPLQDARPRPAAPKLRVQRPWPTSSLTNSRLALLRFPI